MNSTCSSAITYSIWGSLFDHDLQHGGYSGNRVPVFERVQWAGACDYTLMRCLFGFFANVTKKICARSRPIPAIQANQVHQDVRAGNTKTRLRAAGKGKIKTKQPTCGSGSDFP